MQHDHAVYNGNGYVGLDRRSNARLPWDESYLLNAYLLAYAVENDISWLNKFVHQANIAISNMEDPDGDGKRGLQVPDYSRIVVRNAGFEDVVFSGGAVSAAGEFQEPNPSDPTMPMGWTRWQADASTVYLSSSPENPSDLHLAVRTDGSKWRIAEYPVAHLDANTTYVFSCEAVSLTDGQNPRLGVRSVDPGLTLLWRSKIPETGVRGTLSLSFRTGPTPDSDTVLRLYTQNYAIPGTVLYFSFELRRSPESIPTGWERWQSTAQTAFADGGDAVLRTNPARSWQVLQQALAPEGAYAPGARYEVRTAGKTIGAYAQTQIYDWTTRTSLGSKILNSLDLSHGAFDFIAPLTQGHSLDIRLRPGPWTAAGGEARFEEVTVRRYMEYLVHDGMVLIPLLKFAKLVGSEPGLASSYGEDASGYIALARELAEKWEPYWNGTSSGGAYLTPTGAFESPTAYGGCSLPYNQSLAFGEALFHLHDLTGNDDYLDRAGALARTFRAGLEASGQGFVWRYQKREYDAPVEGACVENMAPEDISHANLDISFAVEAEKRGVVFSKIDIEALGKTLTSIMWNGSLDLPLISRSVNGTGFYADNQKRLWWWLKLAPTDPSILLIADAVWKNDWAVDTNGPVNPYTGVWWDQGWRVLNKAALAYYQKKLNGIRDGDFALSPLSASWQRWQSTPFTAFVTSGGFLEIHTNNRWQVVQQDIDFEEADNSLYFPGQDYSLVFCGKTDGVTRLKTHIYDWTSSQTLGILVSGGTDWAYQRLDFKVPLEAGHRISIRFMPYDRNIANAVVWVDDVSVLRASP